MAPVSIDKLDVSVYNWYTSLFGETNDTWTVTNVVPGSYIMFFTMCFFSCAFHFCQFFPINLKTFWAKSFKGAMIMLNMCGPNRWQEFFQTKHSYFRVTGLQFPSFFSTITGRLQGVTSITGYTWWHQIFWSKYQFPRVFQSNTNYLFSKAITFFQRQNQMASGYVSSIACACSYRSSSDTSAAASCTLLCSIETPQRVSRAFSIS